MREVSETKFKYQATFKNDMLLFLVPLGCCPTGSTCWRFENKISFWITTAEYVHSASMCSSVRIWIGYLYPCSSAKHKERQRFGEYRYRALKKHGCCRSMVAAGFFSGTLEHMFCYRYSQGKMREGTIPGFCWTLIIVLPFWTWHMIPHLIPVPSIL